LSGVEQSTISKILKRKQEPSLENLQKLFAGLGLQLADVLKAAADRLPKILRGYSAPNSTSNIPRAKQISSYSPRTRPKEFRQNSVLY
jgi:transcriptional regulator with XRE-family HTH domain